MRLKKRSTKSLLLATSKKKNIKKTKTKTKTKTKISKNKNISHKKNKIISTRLKNRPLKSIKFIGISLGGGKSDRTAITILEYYIEQQKLIVNSVFDRLKTEGEKSADLKIHEILEQYKKDTKFVAIDVPLSLPKCFRCELKCPGYEICEETEIKWMWKQYGQRAQKNKNHKMFTPYTQRCSETFWSEELEGGWSVGDALGSNQAPLLARGRFIQRRAQQVFIEVIPRLSLLTWAKSVKISKIQVNSHRHSASGMIAREYLLRHLADELDIFIYEHDRNLMAEHLVAFDSLWAALTAFWKFKKQCQLPPKDFPKTEGWIEVPQFK